MAKIEYAYRTKGYEGDKEYFYTIDAFLQRFKQTLPGRGLEVWRVSRVDEFPIDIGTLLETADSVLSSIGYCESGDIPFSSLDWKVREEFKRTLDRLTKKCLGGTRYIRDSALLGVIPLTMEDSLTYEKDNRLSKRTRLQLSLLQEEVNRSLR